MFYRYIKRNENNLSNTIGEREYKYQLNGLNEKNQKFSSFRDYKIIKLTRKIYSSLSKINKHYNLKFRIPILHRQVFGIFPQNPEYVQTHCNDSNKPLFFNL